MVCPLTSALDWSWRYFSLNVYIAVESRRRARGRTCKCKCVSGGVGGRLGGCRGAGPEAARWGFLGLVELGVLGLKEGGERVKVDEAGQSWANLVIPPLTLQRRVGINGGRGRYF